MLTRIKNIWFLATQIPGLIFNPQLRRLFQEARSFSKELPTRLRKPLPELMEQITSEANSSNEIQNEESLRKTADLATLLDRSSPLGLCLRRSLTRYYFLRKARMPVEINFGARFLNGKPDRELTGHAWITLNGVPYYEADENWKDFTVMLTYPAKTS